ncbi:MAG: hypothetical protein MUQ10_15105 [Anaerolineae bacterium]|nr:hypothetical protein [Anaerolineae bacterium]
MLWLRRVAPVGLLLLALGCALFDLVDPTSVPVPSTLEEPASISTVTPSPSPPMPTLPPVRSPTTSPCPAIQDLAPPARTGGLDVVADALETYLDHGGDPDRVRLEPQESLLRGDLTGDGSPELVFGLIDPESPQIPPEGRLVIYTCRAGGVERLYQYAPGDWHGLELIAVADLTADGVADLVFSDVSCGAHTCWHTPYVWSWAGSDFVNHVAGALQFPYPVFEVQAGALIVVSGGIGSVGAGPQRPLTTTLSWVGDAITVTDEAPAPPVTRYHAFVDGDGAFAGGDLAAAQSLYQRVLQDETLTAWGAYTIPEEEQQWLRALGRWRLLILNATQGLDADAGAQHAALTADPQPGEPGYPVVALAERFWRSYQRDGDAEAACRYAIDTDEAPAVVDFLNGFGYANPVFESDDLCPYLRP